MEIDLNQIHQSLMTSIHTSISRDPTLTKLNSHYIILFIYLSYREYINNLSNTKKVKQKKPMNSSEKEKQYTCVHVYMLQANCVIRLFAKCLKIPGISRNP